MSQQRVSRIDRWAERVAGLPRVVRMLLAILIALVTAALVSQIGSLLIGPSTMTSMDSVTTLLVLAGVGGLIAYVVGWWLFLGFSREPHLPPSRRSVYFLVYGVLALVAVLIWLVFSFIIASLPPEIPI